MLEIKKLLYKDGYTIKGAINYINNKYKNKNSLLTEMEYSNHSDRVTSRFKYMLENNGKIEKSMTTKKFAQKLLLS